MSNLHSVHDFKPFDAKTSKPFDGQRLAKATYKSSKKNGPAKFKSVCVSIPKIQVSLVQEFLPVIQERIEHAQDGIVRELHEQGISQVTTDQISQSSCIQFLLSELEGERLTKEDVNQWFDSSVSDSLQVLLSEKLGVSSAPTETELLKLNDAVEQFKLKFAAMAGGKTRFSPVVAEKLHKVLSVCEIDDEIGSRFSARLVKMQQEAVDTLAAL